MMMMNKKKKKIQLSFWQQKNQKIKDIMKRKMESYRTNVFLKSTEYEKYFEIIKV